MPTQVTDKLAYYYKNGQLYRVGGGEEGSGTFMSFDITDATEETVDNIPGYTWDITADQFAALCDPDTQSVAVEILIPQTEEVSSHYVFRRDSAVSAGALGGAFFFAVDTSSATTDVVGIAMRLRVYRDVTETKLRIESLGEVMTSDAVAEALSGKANASDVYTKTQVDASLSGKVDKVNGKGLSTNDFTGAYKDAVDANTSARHTHSNKSVLDDIEAAYTTAEKTKLAGIATGAQVNTVNKVNNKTGDVTITKSDLSLENVENKSTATIKSEFTGSVATGDTGFVTGGAVKTYVDDSINNLPEPMVFKGTLGTGGTITSLPTAASSNEGFTYKVITAGTYASQAAKVGDVFISNGSAWVLIPAGDTDSDTWRQIKVNGTSLLGTGISTGAINFKNGSNITITGSGNDITIAASVSDANQTIKGNGTAFGANDAINVVGGGATTVTADTTNKKITISTPDTGATSVEATGNGNVVSGASYDASTRKITLSKGVTALTSHQAVKTLKTDNTTAQSTSSGEAIVGSGTINLHKVAKTGTYGDLLGKPTIPSAVGDLTNDRFVRYDTASQGLTSTQKGNARTNIGAGTGNGSVTSVRVQAGTGLSSSQSAAQTGTLDTTISIASGYKLPTTSEWGGKQDKLVSGTNIKTINGNSILGSGNIEIGGGGGGADYATKEEIDAIFG